MSRFAYVNGRYVPHARAAVHVEDRGYQFADAVYEVCGVRGGKIVDEALHLERLRRSRGEIRIAFSMSDAALGLILREVARRNRIRDGIVYFQVSRGVARRDHAFPADAEPSLVVTARSVPQARWEKMAERGVSVVTRPDERWARCDIKSVSLLANVLAKQEARDAGAYEAWQTADDGTVTEGTSTNAWILTSEGTLVTRPATHDILNGITRRVVKELAEQDGIAVEERPFSVDEAKSAREAFMTASSFVVMPVVKIDDQVIANGEPGSLTLRLRKDYWRVSRLS